MGKPKRVRFLIALVSLFLLFGCVDTEIIDDVRLITGIGFDAGEGDKVNGTALIPYYMPDQKIINNTLTTSGSPTRDLFKKYQEMSPDPIVGGALEVVLFGMDFANKGIYQVLDSLQRDPGVGTSIYLAVVDGTAREILEGDYGKRGNSSYISEMLEHNIKRRDLPKTNFHLFMSDFYQSGKTSYLPIIRKKDKTTVEISGLALLRNGQLVDKIPMKKLFYFKMMSEKLNQGTIALDLGKEKVALESINTKVKKKIVRRNPYEIDVHIKMEAYLNQYTGRHLNHKITDEIESVLERQIRSNAGGLVKQFQEKGVDPIGFGHFVKSKDRSYDNDRWIKSEYKNLKVNIKPSVSIIETGIIE